MIHVVLHRPEIPANTGNIIRLCANTGAQLHLIEPLGFTLEDKQLKRAGLDYHEWAQMKVWSNLGECLEYLASQLVFEVFLMTTKGMVSPFDKDLNQNIAFIFGSETCGLPDQVRTLFDQSRWLKLPMQPQSRSLNLSNSVAVAVYEAWRQQGFELNNT